MASTPEFIPIGSQKHDPAWKHCQMIKCGDRTQLKCIYCGKVFSGGGIHRIKEHLAGQKGNAASCLRVHADVRLSMQQSLDGVVVKKKKKKQKIAEDIRNLAPAINKVENTFVNQNEVDSGLQLLALPNAVDSNSCFPAKEEGFIKSPERRKRGRPKNISPPPTTSDAHPIDKINKELSSYKNASGDFGRKMAIRARNSLFPADWWSTYGGGCPNLTRLAIRILSQTCSTSGCNRDLIPVELIHGRKRNRLEHQRLYDLVFVQYNLRLQQRKLLRNKPFDPISHDNIDHLEDWVVVKEPFFEENGDLDWIALDQPIANTTNSEFTSDEPEGLDTGFDDEEIYNIGIDEEEDDDNGS
ncbi:hypothetical protein AAC387_Pa05g3823 [Persea americana]